MKRMDLEQWRAREVARLLALVEAERRYYQEMVANLPVGVAVVGPGLELVSVNRAFRSILRFSERELRQIRLDHIFPGGELSDRIQEVFDSGQPQLNITAHYVSGEGAHPVRLSIQPFRGWDDEADQEVLLVVQDLTARPSDPGAEALAPAPNVLDNLSAIVWERDPNTMRFLYVGGRAEEMLGYTASQWLESPELVSNRVIHPADREWVEAFHRASASSSGTRTCEYRARTADGRTLWLRDAIRVVRNDQGSAIKLSGITVDITAQKLRDEQVVQAEKMAALSRMASKVTHDCNNLLMILTGYGEDLKESLPEGHPSRGGIDEILGATNHLSRLTSELLSFTRRPSLKPTVFSLRSLIESYEPAIRRELGAEVSLEYRPGNETDQVNADWDQLGDVLLTLAREAGGQLGERGRIRIETSNVELADASSQTGELLKPGPYATLSLVSHGLAVDEETRTRLFEPFFPSRRSGRDLPQVYAVIRDSGGDIRVEVAGDDAVFTIYLPAIQRQALSRPQPEQRSSPETILVAEDEGGIRALIGKVLRKQGYTVLEASNGEEALKTAESAGGPIQLLLTDLVMPGISGRELAEQLKDSQPEMKVLFVSGYPDDDLVRYGPLPKDASFLQKPFSLAALLERVRSVLDG